MSSPPPQGSAMYVCIYVCIGCFVVLYLRVYFVSLLREEIMRSLVCYI